MRKVVVVVLVLMASVVLVASALAESTNEDDHTKVLGIWKLVSYEAEYQATGEREPVFGKKGGGNEKIRTITGDVALRYGSPCSYDSSGR